MINNIWEKYSKEETLKNDNIKLYKCKNKRTQKYVIIKEMNKISYKTQYLNETQIMKIVNLENKISIIEEFEDEENFYIIMELCVIDLEKYINEIRGNVLSIEEIKIILLQINNVFKKLEENKIIHSNLKLSKILLSLDKIDKIKFKLSNFSSSKKLNKDKMYIKNINNKLETTAPEILEKNFICNKSDIWSLGILIYYMIFKEYPFKGDNIKSILEDIKLKQLKSTKNIILDDLLSKMLTININKRISWDEYFSHQFFQNQKYDINKYNIFCEFHNSKINKCYCFDCKKNICELCYNEKHLSHKIIPLSQIGLTNYELNQIQSTLNKIDKKINKIQNIRNDIKLFFNKINEIKENTQIYQKENTKYNFKFYFIEYLKFLKQKIKIKELNSQIKNLKEIYSFDMKNTQITNLSLKKIKMVEPHDDWINSISTFPSGKIISVSYDKSIKIYDNDLNIIQSIENAHDNGIIYVYVRDENNFVTCSLDKRIKTWIKKENKYILNDLINNAHNGSIRKVIFCSNGNLISCSIDKTIKIWEKNNENKYQNKTILFHYNGIVSMLLLDKKNILISSGDDGTKFWNINNYECINYIEEVKCGNWNSMKTMDDDKIIIGEKIYLKVISLSEKRVVKNIFNKFIIYGICVIENKGVNIIGGASNDIKVYRNDNFECIQSIENAHYYDISDIIKLDNGNIVSCSYDRTISIWSF